MWRNKNPISSQQLLLFENKFKFTFDSDFRTFLMDNNAGYPLPGTFPTTVRERKLVQLLDFSPDADKISAWEVNSRLHPLIGPKRVIIGLDSLGNYVCISRHYVNQKIVLWNHITNEFEECLWDIPAFLRNIG